MRQQLIDAVVHMAKQMAANQRETLLKRILLPADGSELAHRSAPWAVAYAKECGAQITVFSVMAQRARGGDPECAWVHPLLPDIHASAVKQRARRHLGEIERKCAQAGVACSAIDGADAIGFACPSDEPHEAIIRAAEQSGCDLIFMAVPGPGGLGARLVGTLAQKVAARSRIAVWIASGGGAPENLAFEPGAPERRGHLQHPGRPNHGTIKDASQRIPNETPCHC